MVRTLLPCCCTVVWLTHADLLRQCSVRCGDTMKRGTLAASSGLVSHRILMDSHDSEDIDKILAFPHLVNLDNLLAFPHHVLVSQITSEQHGLSESPKSRITSIVR